MKENKIKYLPFNAINEFMLEDFKKVVIQKVIQGLNGTSPEIKSQINHLIKQLVVVPGFRNSSQAPSTLKITGSIKTFGKSPEYCALVLSAWSDLNPVLKERVHNLLIQRGWEILPIDTDRTKLPGFLTRWPESETYELINQAYKELYPDDTGSSENDVRLMTVWLSGRLPLEMVDPNQ